MDTILDLFPSQSAGKFGRRQKRERGSRFPVTIVTGFLGAGKTTLVRRFLEFAGGPRHRADRQRVRLGRHRRRAAAREQRRSHAARQRLPVLQHPHRFAERAAQAGGRPRPAENSAFRPRADRDQRARRHQPHPANVLDRSRARRRIRRRSRAHAGRRGSGCTISRRRRKHASRRSSPTAWSSPRSTSPTARPRSNSKRSSGTSIRGPRSIWRWRATSIRRHLIDSGQDAGATSDSGFVAEASHSDGIASFVMREKTPLDWTVFQRTMETLIALRGPDLLRVKGLFNLAGCKGPVVFQAVQHLIHPPVELSAWPDKDHGSRVVFITRGVSERQVRGFCSRRAGRSVFPPTTSAPTRRFPRPCLWISLTPNHQSPLEEYAAMTQKFTLNVNGKTHTVDADPDMPLLYALRDDIGLNNPRFGCGLAQCGACTVHMDGQAIRSCITPVSSVGNAKVVTLGGPRHAREAASAADGLRRGAGDAMRLLRQRLDHDGRGVPGEQEEADRCRDQIRARRRQVPLRHACQHPQGGQARRDDDGLRERDMTKMEKPTTLSRRAVLMGAGALVISIGAPVGIEMLARSTKPARRAPSRRSRPISSRPTSPSTPTARCRPSSARWTWATACSSRSARSSPKSSTCRSRPSRSSWATPPRA